MSIRAKLFSDKGTVEAMFGQEFGEHLFGERCLLFEGVGLNSRQGRVWVVDGCKRVKKLCEVWRQSLFATDDPVTCCDQILCESEIGLFSRDGVICKLCK
jgi:hypothetical protein